MRHHIDGHTGEILSPGIECAVICGYLLGCHIEQVTDDEALELDARSTDDDRYHAFSDFATVAFGIRERIEREERRAA